MRGGDRHSSIFIPGYRDIPTLMDIEQDASILFAGTAHASEIEAGGLPSSRFKSAIDQRLVWAVSMPKGNPVGFGMVLLLESGAHLHEISVRSSCTGKGIGSRLLEHICDVLASRGHDTLTLSTFSDVPWNEPFYASRRFHRLDAACLPEALQAIRRHEARGGLNMDQRVLMRRRLIHEGSD